MISLYSAIKNYFRPSSRSSPLLYTTVASIKRSSFFLPKMSLIRNLLTSETLYSYSTTTSSIGNEDIDFIRNLMFAVLFIFMAMELVKWVFRNNTIPAARTQMRSIY
uniref:Uncharacterized protein n=1 Tax=Chaetoceros debilis TaxID=122233 RepID=A0A7S3PVD4_9STRA|mmetsp:Transcript_21847/g.33212  ORF Transcript_21847/g.33212 Transcript_21847/m.33212 type:complete len:107 (+) Transcript_21847:35-355(+)